MESINLAPDQLVPHLFRKEFRKITTMLCRQYGMQYLGEAEDIASESFLAALETWPYKGIPPNPSAWLFRVAKNKAINRLEQLQVRNIIRKKYQEEEGFEFQPEEEADDEVRMLFAVCHPLLSPESQVALALRVLGGFGIDEIASALLISKDTVNKRLFRAREKIREAGIQLEMPAIKELERRLDTALLTIYLLFTEGYYSETNEEQLREELCFEAMRLAYLLTTQASTNQPKLRALLALFCFHASRFRARKNAAGEMLLYDEQDQSLWNTELIARGSELLHSAREGELTSYHLEAAIAYWYTIPEDAAIKWESILSLYDLLVEMKPGVIVRLNRVYALYKVKGPKPAIEEARKLEMGDNPYYFMLLGELYREVDASKAEQNFKCALSVAKTGKDRIHILQRIHKERTNHIN